MFWDTSEVPEYTGKSVECYWMTLEGKKETKMYGWKETLNKSVWPCASYFSITIYTPIKCGYNVMRINYYNYGIIIQLLTIIFVFLFSYP